MTDAPRPDDLSTEHITWLVESRSKNQQICLKLFLVIKDNEPKIRSSGKNQNNAQSLIAVAFSLWRAVFLSDVESGAIGSLMLAVQSFLGNLIPHNAVAYTNKTGLRAIGPLFIMSTMPVTDWSRLRWMIQKCFRKPLFPTFGIHQCNRRIFGRLATAR